jgi:hypothetical protein
LAEEIHWGAIFCFSSTALKSEVVFDFALGLQPVLYLVAFTPPVFFEQFVSPLANEVMKRRTVSGGIRKWTGVWEQSKWSVLIHLGSFSNGVAVDN